jgi:hypothetical protein
MGSAILSLPRGSQTRDGRFMTICQVCGQVLEPWETRCTHCAVLTAPPDSEEILAGSQSFAYRLARSVMIAAGGAFTGAVAFAATAGVLALLPHLLSGSLLPVIQAAVILAGIFAAVIGFSGILVSLAELQRNASFEISKATLRFSDFHIELEIDLAEVRGVRVEQGWVGRALGYGAIEIFTEPGPNPVAVIPGISRPYAFKEKLELILKHHESSDAYHR